MPRKNDQFTCFFLLVCTWQVNSKGALKQNISGLPVRRLWNDQILGEHLVQGVAEKNICTLMDAKGCQSNEMSNVFAEFIFNMSLSYFFEISLLLWRSAHFDILNTNA